MQCLDKVCDSLTYILYVQLLQSVQTQHDLARVCTVTGGRQALL